MSKTYSVVIPAYNAEKYIQVCLASVSEQTLAPLEVVVIDDHSRDDTQAAVARCAGMLGAAGIGLQYVRLEKNSGPSVARNTGIRMAKGEYIAFLDADDTWADDKLEIVDQFVTGSSAGLVCHAYTDAAEFDDSKGARRHQARSLSMYRMLLRNPAQTSCAVVSKKYAIAFDESMRYCEDYDLWMRIAENSAVLQLVGRPLTLLGRPQLTAGGLSGNTLAMRVGEARVYYNFCRRAWPTRTLILPGLLAFSLLKHLYSQASRWVRSPRELVARSRRLVGRPGAQNK
jgi:teichuronic acid biosynthesis glycosyltransferase TuaG